MISFALGFLGGFVLTLAWDSHVQKRYVISAVFLVVGVFVVASSLTIGYFAKGKV